MKNKKPGVYIFVLIVWICWASIALSQPSCTIGTFLDAPRGDTIECIYTPDYINPLPLTYANDGYPGLYQLTGTQFNTMAALTAHYSPEGNESQIAHVLTSHIPLQNGNQVLDYGYWIPVTIPEPIPETPSWFSYTIDECNYIEINWPRRPIPAHVRICWGQKCIKKPIVLSSDTDVDIGTCWDEARLYYSRDDYYLLD